MYPIKLLISLNKELFDLLKAEKKQTGASMAEIVRRAIKMYFYKNDSYYTGGKDGRYRD